MLVPPRAELHWSPYPGPSPNNGAIPACADCFLTLCREAEACGVESIHVPVSGDLSSALQLAAAAGAETTRLRFRIGRRFEDVLATLRGRDLLDVWRATGGRLLVHMAFEDADPASVYRSAAEFIGSCRALFDETLPPPFDIEGQTAAAAQLAIRAADCLWLRPSRLSQAYADALPVWHLGKEVGLHSTAGDIDASAITAYRQRGFSRFLLRDPAPGAAAWNEFRDVLLPAVRQSE